LIEEIRLRAFMLARTTLQTHEATRVCRLNITNKTRPPLFHELTRAHEIDVCQPAKAGSSEFGDVDPGLAPGATDMLPLRGSVFGVR
jgi:hypothetical protein